MDAQFKNSNYSIDFVCITPISDLSYSILISYNSGANRLISSQTTNRCALTDLFPNNFNLLESSMLHPEFSHTEQLLLSYFLKGYTNREIAKIFFRSEKTIATHKHNICKKLSLKKLPSFPIFDIKE